MSSVSRQARGFTRQLTDFAEKARSRQAWLQAMHVLMFSGRPWAALLTKSGSASSGRAMEMRSASPSASSSSATSGVLMRFDRDHRNLKRAFICALTCRNAARGTEVVMVGTRASCQPMPVLKMSMPAASSAFPVQLDFFPGVAAFHEVEQRKTVHDDEVRPPHAGCAFTISTGRRMRSVDVATPAVCAHD